MQKIRSEVAKEDCWNVESLYPSMESWEKAYNTFKEQSKNNTWPQLQAFRGKLNEGTATVKKALETLFSLTREIHKLYTYAHLRHDEDIADDKNKTAYQMIMSIYYELMSQIAWIEPELLELPAETQQNYLHSAELKDYHFYLEQIFRLKEHTLSADKEELLSLAGKSLQSTQKAFSAINDADFVFGNIQDKEGNEQPLTHATYGIYLRSQDRELRKNSFLTLQGKYRDYQNTIAELLNGTVQSHIFNARTHKYPSCLDAALFPKNIDTSVYHSLIKAVRDNIGTLHRYIALRKDIMNVGQLHLYDMYVPLCKDMDFKIPYKEAEELVIESVKPLGSEYQNILRKGLKDERWVDRYENKNKRSGGYSSGCYDSCPFILMNYKNILRDAFTLAHEAGHSMHSYLSHANQPYHYSDYTIFVAEVASTFNEQLLTQVMLEHAKTKEQKFYLINEKIEDIRSTLFRQTMFAEFELFIHDSAEKNIPLTPGYLKEKYRELNAFYFGNDVIIDEEAAFEWARIPHFYYNFYVYQYATGISAALALYQRVIKGGDKEREDYLGFLKAGSSAYPIDILAKAGVDMRQPTAVASAIAHFGSLVDQLAKEMHSLAL
ncbi:MAG: oligoendopeptidase F [Parachlamydiales bacterium]|jgi:oligoendopeptidase F